MAELQNRFEELKRPRTRRIDENTFKIRPMVSLGTLVVHGLGRSVDGINVLASINNIDENTQLVTFTTKVRPEHFFFIFVFAFITIISLNSEESPAMILILGLWLVFHLWFQLVYRVQEKMVMEKVVDQFKLVEKKFIS